MLEFILSDIREVWGLINDMSHDENMYKITIKRENEKYKLNFEFKEEQKNV